jgi:hypothetical protein
MALHVEQVRNRADRLRRPGSSAVARASLSFPCERATRSGRPRFCQKRHERLKAGFLGHFLCFDWPPVGTAQFRRGEPGMAILSQPMICKCAYLHRRRVLEAPRCISSPCVGANEEGGFGRAFCVILPSLGAAKPSFARSPPAAVALAPPRRGLGGLLSTGLAAARVAQAFGTSACSRASSSTAFRARGDVARMFGMLCRGHGALLRGATASNA